VKDWRDIGEFTGIDLEDSFVLGWDHQPDALVFRLELSVWPEHPLFQAPQSNEHTCYRFALLTFPHPKNVTGLKKQRAVRPIPGSGDYGSIDSLQEVESGLYEMSWENEKISLRSAPLKLGIS
jgi:hypothetical protein